MIDQNPRLKAYQDEAVTKGYQLSLLMVVRGTPLDPKTLLGQCPFTLEQLSDDQFPDDLAWIIHEG